MKPTQVPNSDYLSMLSKKAGGEKNASKAASVELSGQKGKEGFDLLALLDGKGKVGGASATKGKGEFAEILSQKGMLEDISAEDILNFFNKSQSNDSQSVTELLAQFTKITGKSLNPKSLPEGIQAELKGLSFNGKEFTDESGKAVPKNKVLDLLSKLSTKGSTEASKDFSQLMGNKLTGGKGEVVASNQELKSKKNTLPKFNSADFLNHKMTTANSAKNNIQAASVANNHYGKEAANLNNKIIQAKKGNITKGNATKESIANIGNVEKKSSTSSIQDVLQSLSSEQKGDAINLSQINGGQNQSEGLDSNQAKVNQTLDLSNISAKNKTELVQKISNYIEQSYVSGKKSVDMTVNHDELGKFKIQVQKFGNKGQVNLEINTLSAEGKQFFAENEVELLKSLNKSGIRLNDFKLTAQNDLFSIAESSKSSSSSDSSSSGSSGSGNRGEASAFTQDGNRGDNRGEGRRRQLWQEAKSFSDQMYA